MPGAGDDPNARPDPTSTWIEVTIRLAVLGLLLYLSFTLIQPFITIAIWSVVLTVALYPLFCNGPRLVNPFCVVVFAGVSLLYGVGTRPPPDGV
jgi:predicted PurR-regulated permease PerM